MRFFKISHISVMYKKITQKWPDWRHLLLGQTSVIHPQITQKMPKKSKKKDVIPG